MTVETIARALVDGIVQTLWLLWDSFFGLVFGFLISATAQVGLTPSQMHRYLGGRFRNVLYATAFGIVASACSYGAAAAARGFYRRGADVRSVFAFLVASTNMNVAIVVLFWSLLGWRFAFAEFFGGIVIIAVVVAGFTLVAPPAGLAASVEDGLEEEIHCHSAGADPNAPAARGWVSLGRGQTWGAIGARALADVRMLRSELAIGYLIAGYASALVPPLLLSRLLEAVGAVPVVGSTLLLAAGLLIAVVTFVCSMGNVPIARFLASARIPLGANIAFVYGDLLVPPLVSIYRKSFSPRVTWTFVGLFVVGAMLAGAIVQRIIGGSPGARAQVAFGMHADAFTTWANVAAATAMVLVCGVTLASRRRVTSRAL